MKKSPLLLIAVFTFVYACKHSDDSGQWKAVDESLCHSNRMISGATSILYHTFNNKLYDARYHGKALLWKPIADTIKKLSDDMTWYIDTLVAKIDTTAAAPGDEHALHEKLAAYRFNILHVVPHEIFADNPILAEDIKKIFAQFDKEIPLRPDTTGNRENQLFNNTSPASARALLHKMQNDVLITENIIAGYCLTNVAYTFCGFNIEHPIVSVSHNMLKAGEQLEITAGVGMFNLTYQVAVSINGARMPVNDGIAVDTLTAAGKPGKHAVPITIQFTKPDGSIETYSQKIKYTIIE